MLTFLIFAVIAVVAVALIWAYQKTDNIIYALLAISIGPSLMLVGLIGSIITRGIQ